MTQRPSKPATSDFDWQITELFEVLRVNLPDDQMTNAHLAKLMKLKRASGVTQRRNGQTPLQIGEAGLIIEGYGLNSHGLDHRLFEIADRDRFLQELKDHGVGIYEKNPRRRLVQKLEEARAESGLSVEIRDARGKRGIEYGRNAGPEPAVYLVGQRIEIVVRASEGQHIAILERNLDTDYAIKTLAPTATLQDTLMRTSILVLRGKEQAGLEISPPTGRYRLMAIEADEDFVTLFSGPGLARSKDGEIIPDDERPVTISDQMAKAILVQLETTSTPIRCATLDYTIRGNG